MQIQTHSEIGNHIRPFSYGVLLQYFKTVFPVYCKRHIPHAEFKHIEIALISIYLWRVNENRLVFTLFRPCFANGYVFRASILAKANDFTFSIALSLEQM